MAAAKIAFVVGTRPEAIKLAPVIRLVQQTRRRALVISSGQQAHLVGPALAAFGIEPDCDLGVMRRGQSLNDLLARTLRELQRVLIREEPDLGVVQGDTTTALAGALACFHRQIPVAHVEAGLRTRNLDAPFPEEANRQLISRVARMHFAPTVDAKASLLDEGIDARSIEVTGNTIVDSLAMLASVVRREPAPVPLDSQQRWVLVTAHRRENLGAPLRSICNAIRQLADAYTDLRFAFVMHPNPAARRIVCQALAGAKSVALLPPLPYVQLLKLLSVAWLVLTDSGGLQEEAPSFGKPVLVLRDSTERTEGVALGHARLVGTNSNQILTHVTELLHSPESYANLTPVLNPYGDGKAARRIVAAMNRFLRRTRRRIAA